MAARTYTADPDSLTGTHNVSQGTVEDSNFTPPRVYPLIAVWRAETGSVIVCSDEGAANDDPAVLKSIVDDLRSRGNPTQESDIEKWEVGTYAQGEQHAADAEATYEQELQGEQEVQENDT